MVEIMRFMCDSEKHNNIGMWIKQNINTIVEIGVTRF